MTTVTDFLAKILVGDENLDRLDSAVNDAPGTWTAKDGDVVDNLRKRLQDIGFKVPVAFESGLGVGDASFTVIEDGRTYHANPASVPFTTTATFDPAQWLLIDIEATADLAQRWAVQDEDVEVDPVVYPGQFSSLHHAAKAAASATAAGTSETNAAASASAASTSETNAGNSASSATAAAAAAAVSETNAAASEAAALGFSNSASASAIAAGTSETNASTSAAAAAVSAADAFNAATTATAAAAATKFTFNSVAEMKTSTAVQIGDVVATRGYFVAGDKGAGIYEIVAAATGTDDGGLYHNLTGISAQAELQHHGYIKAEQFGAVDGVECSVQMQAAWDALVTWKNAQAVPEDTLIMFTHDSTCTLQNRVTLRDPSDNTRVLGCVVDFSASNLTAVSGGDLSDTNPMILARLRGTQRWGYMNGGKFAQIMDMNGMSGSRSYGGRFLHGKGKIAVIRGASGAFNWFNPHIREYEQPDPEFNTDANFTATGLSVEDGDCMIFAPNILFCGAPMELGAAAVQVHIVNPHLVNGNPNYDGVTVLGRNNPTLIKNYATRENHIDNGYFDNGIVHDYTGTLQVKGGHYVDNNRSDITGSVVKIYATEPGQTTLPDGFWSGVTGLASIDFVDNGANTWAGDMSALASQYARMADESTSIEIGGTRHKLHLSGEGPAEWHHIPQGAVEHHFTTGSNTVQLEMDPTTREYTMRDLATLRVRNTGGDSAVLLGGGLVGIRESSANGGRLELLSGGALNWFIQNDGDLVPNGDNLRSFGTAGNRIASAFIQSMYADFLRVQSGNGHVEQRIGSFRQGANYYNAGIVFDTPRGDTADGAQQFGRAMVVSLGNAVDNEPIFWVTTRTASTTIGATDAGLKSSNSMGVRVSFDFELWRNNTQLFRVNSAGNAEIAGNAEVAGDITLKSWNIGVRGADLGVTAGNIDPEPDSQYHALEVLSPTDVSFIGSANAENGTILYFSITGASSAITFKNGVNNIECGVDRVLNNTSTIIGFIRSGNRWRMICFEEN